MELDRQTTRYFKHKFSHGKNVVARYFDKIFGSLLGFMLLFCIGWALGAGLFPSVTLAVTLVLVFDIFFAALAKYRFGKFLSGELGRVRKNYMLEKLTLLSEEEFAAICKKIFLRHIPGEDYLETLGGLYFPKSKRFCYAFHNHPENPVGVQQLLVLHRKLKKLEAASATVLSAAKYMDETSTMSKRLGVEMELLGQNEFFSAEGDSILPPSEEELKKALKAEMAVAPLSERMKGAFLSPKKSRAYITCAVFLLCWYLIAGFGLLYPIAAGVCIALAVLSYLGGRKSHSKITAQ